MSTFDCSSVPAAMTPRSALPGTPMVGRPEVPGLGQQVAAHPLELVGRLEAGQGDLAQGLGSARW